MSRRRKNAEKIAREEAVMRSRPELVPEPAPVPKKEETPPGEAKEVVRPAICGER